VKKKKKRDRLEERFEKRVGKISSRARRKKSLERPFFAHSLNSFSMLRLRPAASGRLSCHSQRRHPRVVAASASKGFRKKRGDGGGGSEEGEEKVKAIGDDDDDDGDDDGNARPLPPSPSPPPPPPPLPTPTPSAADPSAIAASSAAFAAAMSLSAVAVRVGGARLDLTGAMLPPSAERAAAAALLSAPLLGDVSDPPSLATHAGAAAAAAAFVTGVRAAAVAATSSSSSSSSSSEEGGEEEKARSSSSSYASEFDASLALVLPRLSTAEVALWLCLLPSVAEEALFRSGLLPLVSADWRGAAAVAALFGVLHYSPGAGRGLASAAVAGGAGFVYGLLYCWTGGDLVATAGAHALANAGSAALWWSRREREKEKM